ncbi:NAD(P)/FAD-dependent oxidoreductase [Desulforhabdus amnigena]|jgi:thioredoxin reductase (NADPH)|uniref:Thioredoxin reductase n=1 Tax=Desulforhabdus amnigena TaxID=40218 RepID=A0A9W6FUE6_9BACT|nr:FAD-dependent oxidoreductase [Desulforhabdus amnigena]NLJ27537.1 FAD-dependent oxidoreductase [Deltaproteobacteria bacterium]GLI35058.1 thioredoxin reductase [Desulforhabdus amnigena]
MKETRSFDVLIIGGGIAGMTAAIYLARANVRAVILEKAICGGLCNYTYVVENFPSYPSIHGMDLMQKVREHVDYLGVAVEEVCEIERLDITGREKIIETDEAIYKGTAVIVATGRKPILLDVPGGEAIHYCSVCDGFTYAGKRVLVVGGGNSGFDESLYLMRIGIKHLTLVEVMDRFFAAQSAQDELLKCGDVDARKSTKVLEVLHENGKVQGVVLENVATGERETLEVDGVFVFMGQNPTTEFLKDIVDLDDYGYVLAKEDMSTSIPGVFSAGDLNRKQFRQLTTAMSDGTIAALACERYVRSNPG